MPQYNQITKTVTLAANTGTVRVWDAPYSTPVKNLTIIVRGSVPDLTELTQQVFFGGYFVDSGTVVVTPFTEGSIHLGGVSQGDAAAIGTGTELAHVVYTNTGVLPANNIKGSKPTPVVIEFVNTNTVGVTFEVTFVSETLNSTI